MKTRIRQATKYDQVKYSELLSKIITVLLKDVVKMLSIIVLTNESFLKQVSLAAKDILLTK